MRSPMEDQEQLVSEPAQAAGDEPGDDGALQAAIDTVIEAAQSAGFHAPPEGIEHARLPKVYRQMLDAAYRSDMARDPRLAAIIRAVDERLSQVLGENATAPQTLLEGAR